MFWPQENSSTSKNINVSAAQKGFVHLTASFFRWLVEKF
jgi:hypothetical protein